MDLKTRAVIRRKFGEKQNRIEGIYGFMGDSNGLVTASRPEYVNVRLPDNTVIEVYNKRVAPKSGVPVQCGYDPLEPFLFQVLSIWTTPLNTPESLSPTYMLPHHAPTHQYFIGNDVVFVDKRQYLPARVGSAKVGGLNVDVYQDTVYIGGAWSILSSQTISLSSYITGLTTGKSKIILLSYKSDGTITKTPSGELTYNSELITDVPAIPSGEIGLAAVRLYYGQTTIRDGYINRDIMDARTWLSPSGGGGGAISAYRIPITIIGTVVGEQTNYSVRLAIAYNDLMFPDFSDVHFVDSDGITPLTQWLELWIDSERAVFWVKVPTIPASPSSIIIYAIYGEGITVVSNDSGTFPVGADFDDGATTGLTINVAGSGAMTVPTITSQQMLGLQVGAFSKYPTNPVLAKGTAGAWDDWGVRELCPVIDINGKMVIESDGIWAYYWGTPDGSRVAWQIGLAKSVDNGITWTRYASNPVIAPSGVVGSWYRISVNQPSVIKLANSTRLMMAVGVDSDDHDSIGVFTSTDGVTWVDGGQKLTLAQFNDGGTAVTEMGVPSVIKKSDGNYLCMLEALVSGIDGGWRIFGATSPDFVTWTPLNSGHPLLSPTGAGWESVGVANPHIIEVTAGNYLIAYNGRGDGAYAFWAIGFASSTDLTTWTRYASNPVIVKGVSGQWDDGQVESCFLIKEDSSFLRLYYNGFNVDGSHQVGLALCPQTRFLHGVSAATGDGWVAGASLAGVTGFELQAVLQDTADASDSANCQVALVDSASVPSPTTNTTWNAMVRFFVGRDSPTRTTSGKSGIGYITAAGATKWWDGSTWQDAITYFGGPGLYKIKIWDDGTNYKADILRMPGEVSILANVASIAKSTVKAFSDGRVVVLSEGLTNYYYMGQNFDNVIIRTLASPEPTSSQDPEEIVPHYSVTVQNTATIALTIDNQKLSAVIIPSGIDAGDLVSGAAGNGTVLTADGAGGSAWEAPVGAGNVAADAIWDALGDLAVGTGANTAAKLTVGSNGKVLVAASGEATGLKWDTPAGGGDVVGPANSADGHLAVWDGTDSKTLKDGGAPGSGGGWPYPADGRLTLETGVPVSTTDQTAKTTLYYTPHKGDQIALYNGATWDLVTFAEISIAIPATTSQMYDVFVYNNGGTATLELLAWTNDTTRATALIRQNGILCKTGALTRRYLGSVRTTGASGQTADADLTRYLWNYYNRVDRRGFVTSTTSHYYDGTSWRSWNNDAALRTGIITGVVEDVQMVSISGDLVQTTNAPAAWIGACIDNTNSGTFSAGEQLGNGYRVRIGETHQYIPALGYHYWQATEYSSGARVTFSYMMLTVGYKG